MSDSSCASTEGISYSRRCSSTVRASSPVAFTTFSEITVPDSPSSWLLIWLRLSVRTSVSPICVIKVFAVRPNSSAGLLEYTRVMRAYPLASFATSAPMPISTPFCRFRYSRYWRAV